MTENIRFKRDYVSKQYSGSWPARVAAMPDWQVSIIYRRMVYGGKKRKGDKYRVHGGEQISIFDILKENDSDENIGNQ